MTLLAALLAAISLALPACERGEVSELSSKEAERSEAAGERLARGHAARHGAREARIVVFVAQELTQLDPRSDRSKNAREARELLDDIVSRETSGDAAD